MLLINAHVCILNKRMFEKQTGYDCVGARVDPFSWCSESELYSLPSIHLYQEFPSFQFVAGRSSTIIIKILI